MNRYRVYCTTDNKVEYINSLTEPTECPTDAGHSIDGSLTTLIEENIVDPAVEITDPTAQAIDATYDYKILDGQAYYRKKRAELVKLIITETITEADADYIDTKLERVQLKLSTGDWKSAKKRLLEVVVEGAFTQAMYDEYETEINSYISDHY
jgi:hypothetical protein